MEFPIKTSHFYAGAGALITWSALIIQYLMMLRNRTDTFLISTIHFFSYFTILSNILVALVFTTFFLKGGKGISPSLLTATCLYIAVVAVIYNLVLRKLSSPEGWNRVANELLHVVVPVIFVLFWIIFIPKTGLGMKDSFVWLSFPLLYLIYTIISGYFTQWYPYPFVNVSELGATKTLFNCLGVAMVFWILGGLLIWLKLKTGR